MTDQIAICKPARMRGLALVTALALTVIGGLTTPKRAEAWFASEVTQVLNNISLMANQFQDYAAYADDVARWRQQAADMQNLLSKIQNMQLSLGLKDGQEMREIDDPKTFMVRERCGSQYGDGASGVIGSITGVNLNGKVFEDQYKRCAQKQWLQNEKFNIGVRYLKQNMQEMQADFLTSRAQANGSKNLGDGSTVNADGQAMFSKYQMKQQNHQQLMDAYDAAIASLDGQMGSAARKAMRGESGLIRQMVSTAAVYTALCGGGKCDDGQ